MSVVEVEETLDAGLEAAHRKFDEVLVFGRTEALNVMIEACRNVSSVRSHFVVVFSDVYLRVMKGGVVAHLSLVVSQCKPTRTPNDCLRTATRLVAEVTSVWTDDADFMPQHDELAALLCAVTCEVNEAEIDAALEAFDHIDTDRLATRNLVRTALNKNFWATSERDFEGQDRCDSMWSSMTAYDNVRGRPCSPKSKAKILLQVRDVHDLLTNWTDDADLGRSDFVEKVGSSRHARLRTLMAKQTELRHARENLTVSASAKCICEIKDNLDAELLRCQEKLLVFWDAQVAAYGARGTAVVKRQTDLLGGLDGTS